MLQTYPVFLSNNGDKVPAGIRVVEPVAGTKQAERGSLVAIVDLAAEQLNRGQLVEREQLVEQMLAEIESTYYSHKGKQSAVLVSAVQSAVTFLADYHAQQRASEETRLTCGVICVGILHDRLMIAHAGPMFALLSVGQRVEMFPLEAQGHPQEHSSETILRRELSAGDAIFLGSSAWEEAISLRVLAATVAHIDPENRFDAASGILEQVRSAPPPGLFLVISDAQNAANAVPSAAASSRRPALGGLPTAVGVPPSTSAKLPPVEAQPAKSERKPSKSPEAPPVHQPSEERQTGSPSHTPALEPQLTEISETPFTRLTRFLSKMLPEAQPAASADATTPNVEVAHEPVPIPVAAESADPSKERQANKADPHFKTYTPPPPAKGGRARIFILTALVIALAVTAIVSATVWQKGATKRAEAEAQLGIAVARVGSAQTAIDTGNKENALQLLTEARDALKAREALLPGTDSQSDDLTRQIAQIEQQVLQVQRLYGLVQPLIQFPAGSRPTRVLVVDQDIYILDEGRQVVERYRLDQRKETVPDPTAQVLIRQGDTIDGAQVGPLVDFTWQLPVPGYDDKSNLFILDANNNVFRFNPRVDGAALINLGGPDKVIKSARQLKTFTGRLYVADVGNNQLYRFQPGEYEVPPEAWFPENTQYDLTGLHTMRIDGNIWMLFDDGKILRFFNGQQAPFALDNRLGPAQQPVDLAVSEEDNGRLYLADRAQSRVIVYDKTGAYVSQLAAPEGDPLQNLSGLFIEDVTNTLYLLTDNALFQHDLPE